MKPVTTVDLAILGGGCAGLSLAHALAASHVTGSVVILEPRSAYTDDRSWCFWASNSNNSEASSVMPERWRDQVHHSWAHWRLVKLTKPRQAGKRLA